MFQTNQLLANCRVCVVGLLTVHLWPDQTSQFCSQEWHGTSMGHVVVFVFGLYRRLTVPCYLLSGSFRTILHPVYAGRTPEMRGAQNVLYPHGPSGPRACPLL